jgi:hypothetical protein
MKYRLYFVVALLELERLLALRLRPLLRVRLLQVPHLPSAKPLFKALLPLY